MNEALQAALERHWLTRERYVSTLSEMGIAFAGEGANQERIDELRGKLAEAGAEFKNAGASVVYGWESQACIACTSDTGSETFSTTFKCHRDCYFCFNRNLAGYETFVKEGCPWEDELQQAQKHFGNLAAIGLTGGEPLLVLDDSIEFLNRAGELFPHAHKRLYTSGDLLTDDAAARLAEAGLTEIRFSVKQDDTPEQQARVLEAMEIAKRHIPDVMVEMPIIPGTGEQMRALFDRWNEIGITGINLLEFCFPFANWDEYAKRGFEVRNPPFDVMYDYMYSGGLPVAGSEELALELMLYGIEKGVTFGMHYCSLDNKHRSEMRQQNERGAYIHLCFEFDEGDFFLKCAKVFGEDIEPAEKAIREAGCTSLAHLDDENSLCFPVHYLSALTDLDVQPALSYNVLEQEGDDFFFQEVDLRLA